MGRRLDRSATKVANRRSASEIRKTVALLRDFAGILTVVLRKNSIRSNDAAA